MTRRCNRYHRAAVRCQEQLAAKDYVIEYWKKKSETATKADKVTRDILQSLNGNMKATAKKLKEIVELLKLLLLKKL